MNTEAVLPNPPLLLNCRPGTIANTSTNVRPVLRSSMARSITDTSAASALTRSGRRVAVTTTGSCAGPAAAAGPVANAVKAASVTACKREDGQKNAAAQRGRVKAEVEVMD